MKVRRPLIAKYGRAHGLPKTNEPFDQLPKFRPIVDIIDTPHYKIGEYLANLINPLTIYNHTLKDSFDAANRIRAITPHLLAEGSKFVSFDVSSLFTNCPLSKTISIIINRVYVQ